MIVDFKFGALYRWLSLHRGPPEVGSVKKLYGKVCISGWDHTWQPYIESAVVIMKKLRVTTVFGER